jgi:hypothetical protein
MVSQAQAIVFAITVPSDNKSITPTFVSGDKLFKAVQLPCAVIDVEKNVAIKNRVMYMLFIFFIFNVLNIVQYK